jgi:hypothetical protein
VGTATFVTPGDEPVAIEVRATHTGIVAVCDHRDAHGRSFRVEHAASSRELADLLRQVTATCAVLHST